MPRKDLCRRDVPEIGEAITASDYAQIEGLSENDVIKLITDRRLLGTQFQGLWYVEAPPFCEERLRKLHSLQPLKESTQPQSTQPKPTPEAIKPLPAETTLESATKKAKTQLTVHPTHSSHALLIRRAYAGLSLGVAFVVTVVLAFIAFAFTILYPMNPKKPGSEARSATMLLWMFLGAYMAGFFFCSLPPDDPRNTPKQPKGKVALALFGSMLVIFFLGRLSLESLGLYWDDWTVALEMLFFGLILGAGLWFWLNKRFPSVFPCHPPKHT